MTEDDHKLAFINFLATKPWFKSIYSGCNCKQVYDQIFGVCYYAFGLGTIFGVVYDRIHEDDMILGAMVGSLWYFHALWQFTFNILCGIESAYLSGSKFRRCVCFMISLVMVIVNCASLWMMISSGYFIMTLSMLVFLFWPLLLCYVSFCSLYDIDAYLFASTGYKIGAGRFDEFGWLVLVQNLTNTV